MKKKEKSYKRLKFFILTGVFATSLFVLLVSDIGRNKDLGTLQKLIVEVFAPIEQGISFVGSGFGNLWENYLNLINVQEENRMLREEIKKLQAKNNEYREERAANIRYKKLLSFKESSQLPVKSATVIGYDPSVWYKTVMINRGSNDGLQRGMAVISADGIVGQIIGVSLHYAKILLVTDGNSAVDALIQRNRVRGILKGLSSRACQLDYVDSRDDVKSGDVVVSSGLGGIFPKGLPVGRVMNVERSRPGLFQYIEVEPAVDFSKIEEVLVILQRDSVME